MVGRPYSTNNFTTNNLYQHNHNNHTPLAPAGCAWLTRYGRLSTYEEIVLKLFKVSFRGKCARTGHPLKLPSPTKLARLGHFPPASQAGRLAGPVFCTIPYLFSDHNHFFPKFSHLGWPTYYILATYLLYFFTTHLFNYIIISNT
jgi:hypothetical protein